MFKRFIVLVMMIVCLVGCHGSKSINGLNEHKESPIGYPNVTEYGNLFLDCSVMMEQIIEYFWLSWCQSGVFDT